MRIVTLGHTGVGKTTYMVSLYGELQRSFEGFTLGTDDLSDHTSLLNISAAIRRGEYPSPTAHRSEYEFSLKFGGTEVLKFNWSDYSGGAIVRASYDQQAKLLLQDLEQADGLMLMCDSEALIRGDFRRLGLGRMTTMVARAVRNLSRPISLAVVFTKSDLVPSFNPQMLRHFGGLINAIEVSDQVVGALIPVACGRQALNVPMPLFFALQAAMSHKADTLAKEMKSDQREAERLRENNEGINRLIDQLLSLLTDRPTKEQRANAYEQKADSKKKEHQNIKPSLDRINQQVLRLPLLKRGLELGEYAEQLNQAKNTHSRNLPDYIDLFDLMLKIEEMKYGQ